MSTRRFALTVRFPAGGPLVGGRSPVPDGLHAAHAEDRDGNPILPATALRGALREALEALLRGAGERACAGGDGRDPGASTEGASAPAAPPDSNPDAEAPSPVPCTLGPGHQPCLACQLFGTRRPGIAAGERCTSGLVLSDGRLASDPGAVRWYARPGVSLARSRRSAEDQRLFFQRVPAARDLRFVAEGRLRIPTLAPMLEAAVRATTHVGAGRSRGLAHVDLHLRWLDQPAPDAPAPDAPAPHAAADPATLPGPDEVLVIATLRAPAAVGAPIVTPGYRDARHDIPGATLRGAVGFALAELLADPDADADFQALVDAHHGAHFGFLHALPPAPAPDGADPSRGITAPIGPLPITAAACKHAGHAHGVLDTLLDRLVMAHATSAEQAGRAARHTRTACPRCHAPLRGIAGSRHAADPPPTRAVTRVSMDRARASARDEHLFTQVLLDQGARFAGTIRHIPGRGRDHLARALGSELLSLGRGRASGWGQVHVDIAPAPVLSPMAERGRAFDQALAARLDRAGLAHERVGRLVPVTLLAPLIDGDDHGRAGDGARGIAAALGARDCFLVARRFAREGGWDQRRGKLEPILATAAGAVFVVALGDATWHDLVPRLEQLERDGVGARRHQGYGQVICFDPFFLRGQPDAAPTAGDPDMSDPTAILRPFRKDLVLAAEDVMKRAFQSGGLKARSGKSQLNRLVAVCSEATCAEEIESYLRYQASRDQGEKQLWDLGLVKQVIDAIQQPLRALEAARPPGDPDTDTDKVQAWRLYAVFLARAFTYRNEVHKQTGKHHKESRHDRGR